MTWWQILGVTMVAGFGLRLGWQTASEFIDAINAAMSSLFEDTEEK
ncbi:hypothetical protein [Celeribacter baekdonensis]|tara:strand:- start:11798 stop:11935 length:138 start_codon:yes stop_codon:yes gene_type:complete